LIDLTLEEIKEIYALGIRAVNIYVKVSEKLKTYGWNKDGLMQEAIRAIKAVCPEMIDARCLRTLALYTRRIRKWRGSKRCQSDALVKWPFSCSRRS
jgi:delta-aminolevulinic acid dehydratase/porphobilinogen synthase